MSERRTGPEAETTRRIVGAMSGTSLDGVDAALVDVIGGGLSMDVRFLAHAAVSLGPFAEPFRRISSQLPVPVRELARLTGDLTERYGTAIAQILAPGPALDLIAVHGQTVLHEPPLSWQLLNPAPLARRFGCPVVSDLRQADLAAGGEGAPITPIADWVLFRDVAGRRAIVNLGGFCNITILPAGDDEGTLADVEAFDVCACNQLLDAVARTTLDRPFDEGGRAAWRGRVDARVGAALEEMLEGQRVARRSLGTGDEAAAWLETHVGRLAGEDLAATAVAAVAGCVVRAIDEHGMDEIVLAGGGARNAALVEQIGTRTGRRLCRSDALGIPIEAREATAMAVLGALCADGVPITLPRVTGCTVPAPVAGLWTGLPGVASLREGSERSTADLPGRTR